VFACVSGVAATWIGILLAYDSYYWGTSREGLPVSFFIVALVFLGYLASGLPVIRAATGGRGETDPAQAARAAEHEELAV
jgi:zinc/manganese transport system permease protein